jgi:DNA-binding NtrC family response regulator
LLIADAEPSHGWNALLAWVLRTPRPHVVLFAGAANVPGLQGIGLELFQSEALARSVEPQLLDPDTRRRVEDAAARAGGLPGRFARLLWGDPGRPLDRWSGRAIRAAEQPTAYRVDADGAGFVAPRGALQAGDDLPVLCRRLEAAIDLLRQGRHASGGRALRQAVGALVRRGALLPAARGELALAGMLLARGRLRDAEGVLADAREHAARCTGTSPALIDVAVFSGLAALERGRLDEAEAILNGAVAVARAHSERRHLLRSHLALARCLFWRGRYEDAHHVVSATGLSDTSIAEPAGIELTIARSRIAVGRGDLGTAISQATNALQASESGGSADLVAESAYAVAFAHLAAGDHAPLAGDVKRCVVAARAARNPLRAVKARLVEAEAVRRGARGTVPSRLLERLSRLPGASLPATVRAHAELLIALTERSAPPEDTLLRHTSATGLHALALFVPFRTAAPLSRDPAPVGDVLELLQCCQRADDERTVVQSVCATLRRRLSAASVAFLSREGALLAVDGRRSESEIARRVIAAGQPIAPYLQDGSVEGGAPVHYAGETIAALVSRWTIGSPCDVQRALEGLTVAAAAAAPAVAETIARGREAPRHALDGILGLSPAIAEVRRAIESAAISPFPVLIQGESGSGKELVARSLHRRSPRRDRPFCTVNCAALPDDLVESELFGHARGAFTGAALERPGLFEEAHTGTLFLDEIGELSPRAQAKVLRTLQDGEVRRVGENVARRVDVRVVAATNRDLAGEAAANRFRLDLLYRLDVVRIAVPPLRDRRDDIALLVARFWSDATSRIGSRATLSTATVAVLSRYDWPGNVRELQNVLAALAVRSPKRGVVGPTALPAAFGGAQPAGTWTLEAARRTFEERFVRAALVRTGGHRAHAAQELGVTRQGLTKLMARLGISD